MGFSPLGNWEPPDVGLAPTRVWRAPPPIPHFNWRTLPSSQTPSLPALSFPLPPTPLGSFCKAPGGGGPGWWGGGVLGRKGVEGGASKRHLGPDPHLGVLEERSGGQKRFCGKRGFKKYPPCRRQRVDEEWTFCPHKQTLSQTCENDGNDEMAGVTHAKTLFDESPVLCSPENEEDLGSVKQIRSVAVLRA